MKGWERQWTIFKSNAKYGDTLHPHASKQSVHLPNYITSHTNQCDMMKYLQIFKWHFKAAVSADGLSLNLS